ncbi:MAG TPA: transglutaminase domain-containing protein [Kofleriaceae bacterium]|nr:transglutaminase domain-containing protein [Kofleriaceae bacterium]
MFAALVGCAPPPAAVRSIEAPVEQPRDQVRQYTIWLGGARVGTAIERETWTPAGVHLRRDEDLRFARGDADVALATTIEIDANAALVASHVRWTQLAAGETAAEAVRGEDGWQVSTGIRLPASAVPAELVPLLVRRDGSFAGRVFLPARGFVAGSGRIEPVAPGRLVARFSFDSPSTRGRADGDPEAAGGGARAESTIDLDRDGSPARVVDGEGVIELRASADQARAPFAPVDLVAATAVPIAGERCASCVRRLVLEGDLALPPVPGQAARPAPTGGELVLDRALPGDLPAGEPGPDRAGEIATIVAAVRARITPDLGAAHTTAADAAVATAGDCTTFALAYAALATSRGIPTRVVTGLRIDDDGARLVRHRWAVSWTGRAWIAVDAAFGSAPAGGNLVGLAVHDADDAGLVAGEAALAAVRAATWSR